MSSPAQIVPPQLSGYQHIRILGKGGFAYVFLYEQDFPRAEVAVKVLNPKVADAKLRTMFLSEANLMSQLKTHPSVLTVHTASISPDGRPYLVMEYCPSSLGSGYKQQPLTPSEVLRVGIKIGSALETAHRIGFLHRDIKPSNVLLTQYGHPVLADFGIAATVAAVANDEAEGMSIPWSAPEVLRGETAGTPASEVYSLAATLFTLLLGRSPYELVGDDKQRNRRERVKARIIGRDRLQPLGRPDVPAFFEEVLSQAMSKNPAQRPPTMLDFVRNLQMVEAQMGFAQTPAEIADDVRVQQSRHVLADQSSVNGPAVPSATSGVQRRYRHTGRADEQIAGEDTSLTVIRSASVFAQPVEANAKRSRKGLLWGLIGGGVALLAVAGAAAYFLLGNNGDIPVVSNIVAEVDSDVVTFTWDDPGLADSDRYVVRSADGSSSTQTDREFRATSDGSGAPVCITVTVTRDGKPGASSSETCQSISAGQD
ncbi:serine/threonine-protein kinase [Lysinibacter cavernae]|uniref:non-specific serine/threonine protein kinase n=1 Tax=Lysinibacter cavernae TaxID=1640652 RepID=A0A7X5R0U1_9MICO|nr:serine/threonine-protein kinase [Lysinibacter cavernae]NIH53610.1 serine/threonine protein kinase [Lysinibacter cavernae]